jgi:hypothetical protein
MEIERLNGLRHRVVHQEMLDLDYDGDREIITDLIDAEIARQSVTDEAVLEAIGILEEPEYWITLVNDWGDVKTQPDKQLIDACNLAIQALRPMQPVKPCEWCELAEHCEYEVTYFEGDNRWATSRSLMPKYCPNCGRALKDGE